MSRERINQAGGALSHQGGIGADSRCKEVRGSSRRRLFKRPQGRAPSRRSLPGAMEREQTDAPAEADGLWETLPRVRRPPPVLYNVNALTAVQRIAPPKPKPSKGAHYPPSRPNPEAIQGGFERPLTSPASTNHACP